MIKKTGKVSPARVVTELDKPGAELDTKKHPAQYQYGNKRRCDTPACQERGEEPRLNQHQFPAECVERLADIDNGKIKDPDQKPYPGGNPHPGPFADANERKEGENDTGAGDNRE